MNARGMGSVPPTGAAGATKMGTVVAFDSRRGLGEIRDGDDRPFPFHCTKIADGTREIPVGVAVEFRIAPGPLGRWEAVEIRPCRSS
jgi:cold shock CspA family protein